MKKAKQKQPKHTFISWDWKLGPSEEELTEALAPFGLFVYPDPQCEGSDSYGYILSERALTRDEITVLSEDEWGDPFEDE